MMVISSKPKVSIIIAVYNAVGTLSKCLSSIREQDYQHREVIVIDGGSTDGTVKIIESNQEMISFWCSEPDHGIYDAWNKGLTHATGDWICFLGADDYYAEAGSLGQVVGLAAPAVNFISSKIAYVDARGSIQGIAGRPWSWEAHKVRQRIAHPGALHAHLLFKEYGTFDGNYRIAGDYEFLLRCGKAIQGAFCNRVTVNVGNNGVSQRQLRKIHNEIRLIQSRHADIGRYRAACFYAVRTLKRIGKELSGERH